MELEEKIQTIEDKLALKQLVDTFSILSDEKNGLAQKGLFTSDAVVKIVINDELKQTLNGPEEIGNAYHNYLTSLDKVFHLNGQHVVNVKGNRALGRCYSQATIFETQNGVQVMTQEGTYHDDEYRKENDRWLIAKRTTHYVWIIRK